MTMEEARGKALHAAGGERIGDVDRILADIQTRKPEWFRVATGMTGRKRLLVPVAGSEVREQGVFVHYSADQIRSTPEVEGDRISQETERRLYAHYGLPYSERRSATGLPERPRDREGRRRKPTRDEPTRRELYEEARRLGIEGRSKMNKRELQRAVERSRGAGDRRGRESESRAKANPVEVQRFLEGVDYPTGRRELAEEANRQGASEEVRATLDRLPDERFDTPTDVSEAIGKLS